MVFSGEEFRLWDLRKDVTNLVVGIPICYVHVSLACPKIDFYQTFICLETVPRLPSVSCRIKSTEETSRSRENG